LPAPSSNPLASARSGACRRRILARRPLLAATILLFLSLPAAREFAGAGAALARPQPGPRAGRQRPAPLPRIVRVRPDRLEGGRHWRFVTPQGPVHVWRPRGYHNHRAGIVVYVHGHFIDVDRAWRQFHLARQFRASRQNALFIVPEAPRSFDHDINYPALGRLLRMVVRATGVGLPRGHIVAVAHSGGFRTVASWLDYRWLNHVILLDALYGGEEEFGHWIDEDKRHRQHKMVLVGSDTRRQSERFVRQFRYGRRRGFIPGRFGDLTRPERRTRLLYMTSQYGHNEMVKNGKVLPLVLRNTRLRRL
jgi:hypothetical protein